MIKAYLKDWAYTEHWNKIYTSEEALKIVKKLTRHFKLHIARGIKFTRLNTGLASYNRLWGYGIILPKYAISLGMICHEIGHCLARKKEEIRVGVNDAKFNHNNKTYRQMFRVYKYANRFLDKEKEKIK